MEKIVERIDRVMEEGIPFETRIEPISAVYVALALSVPVILYFVLKVWTSKS